VCLTFFAILPTITASLQVEAALCQHPGVAAAAVFGVPDVRLGERVAAVVVVRPGWVWQGLLLQPSRLQDHTEEEQQQQGQQDHGQQGLQGDLEQQQQQQQQQQQLGTQQGGHALQEQQQGRRQQHNKQHQIARLPREEHVLSADGLLAFCRTGGMSGASATSDSQVGDMMCGTPKLVMGRACLLFYSSLTQRAV